MNDDKEKKSRKDNPLLVRETWEDTITLLKNTYTTSFRGACRTLMCSRQWVTDYVRPYVTYIYLTGSQGYYINSLYSPSTVNIRAGANYVKLAEEELGRKLSESVWLNTDEFEDLIRNNLTCTRQTIKLPYEIFLPDDPIVRADIFEKYQLLKEDIANAATNKEKKRAHIALANFKNDAVRDDLKALFDSGLSFTTKRTECSHVPCDLPDNFQLTDLIAMHDCMDYGDNVEEYSRIFFREGYFKLELKLTNTDGKEAVKKFFLPPCVDLDKKIKDIYNQYHTKYPIPGYVIFKFELYENLLELL